MLLWKHYCFKKFLFLWLKILLLVQSAIKILKKYLFASLEFFAALFLSSCTSPYHDKDIKKTSGDFRKLSNPPLAFDGKTSEKSEKDLSKEEASCQIGDNHSESSFCKKNVDSTSLRQYPGGDKNMPPYLLTPISLCLSGKIPLQDIFMELAQQVGVNIFLDPQVNGRQSLFYQTQGQPLGEVLDNICTLCHLRYEIKGNVLKILQDRPYFKTHNIQFLLGSRRAQTRTTVKTDMFSPPGMPNSIGDGQSNIAMDASHEVDFWIELERNITMILGASKIPLSHNGEKNKKKRYKMHYGQRGSSSFPEGNMSYEDMPFRKNNHFPNNSLYSRQGSSEQGLPSTMNGGSYNGQYKQNGRDDYGSLIPDNFHNNGYNNNTEENSQLKKKITKSYGKEPNLFSSREYRNNVPRELGQRSYSGDDNKKYAEYDGPSGEYRGSHYNMRNGGNIGDNGANGGGNGGNGENGENGGNGENGSNNGGGHYSNGTNGSGNGENWGNNGGGNGKNGGNNGRGYCNNGNIPFNGNGFGPNHDDDRPIVEETQPVSSYSLNRYAGILTVYGNHKQQQMIEGYLRQLQRLVTTQLLIEAKIIEIDLFDDYKGGVNWQAFFNGNPYIGSKNIVPLQDVSHSNDFSGSLGQKDGQYSFTLDTKYLHVLASFMERFGTARTLANIRQSAINNQGALLKIAHNEVYFELMVENHDGAFQRNSYINRQNISSRMKTIPIGVILYVHPSINIETGDIVVSLHPTISRVVGVKSDPATAMYSKKYHVESQIPIVQVREMDSVIATRDGKVVVLGGLMEERVDNDHTQLPGVSKIPIVGSLFQNKNKKRRLVELVILLKVSLVKGNNELCPADERLCGEYLKDPRPF